jgi:hypothetical protein
MEATMAHASRIATQLWIATGLLSACGPMPIANEPMGKSSAEPVLCVGRQQCDIYWQRAQAWVANNSEYRLERVTDTIIETQGPLVARNGWAYRVTRVPDDKDGAQIYILATCANAFGCSPGSSDVLTAFRRFVAN